MKRNTAIYFCAATVACAACNDAADTGIENLADTPTFAVQLSDYQSAGVALIDGEGVILSEKYISSATALPGLSAALHGDIALPTTPCDPSLLTVIARKGGDYLLQVDLDTSSVMRQVRTQGEGAGSFSANPQDALCLSDGSIMISRFDPNPAEGAGLDAGDDIVVMRDDVLMERVDLSGLRGTVTGEDADGNAEEQTAYARPGALVRVGDFAAVGLSRLTLSFSAASGLLGLVDLASLEVTSVELPSLANCGSLAPVAGRDDAVIVSCAGSPFGDPASAGFALVSVDETGEATVENTYTADSADVAIYSNPVSLGGTRIVGVATGDFSAEPPGPDEAFVLDLATGEARPVFATSMPGTIGVGAFRAETGLLVLPDAEKGVRVFSVLEDTITETAMLPLDAALPARGIRRLR